MSLGYEFNILFCVIDRKKVDKWMASQMNINLRLVFHFILLSVGTWVQQQTTPSIPSIMNCTFFYTCHFSKYKIQNTKINTQ